MSSFVASRAVRSRTSNIGMGYMSGRQRLRSRLLLGAVMLAGAAAGVDAAPVYTVYRAGLVGPATAFPGLTNISYTQTTGVSSSTLTLLSTGGFALGTSSRYNTTSTPVNASAGTDVWVFNPFTKTSSVVNLTGGVYDRSDGLRTGAVINLVRNVPAITASGKTIGTSQRYLTTAIGLGQDAWYFDGSKTVSVGYTGTGYEYVVGNNVFRSSSPVAVTDAGRVIVRSNRYTADGSAAIGSTTNPLTGQDISLETPATGTRTLLGLSGSNYSFTNPTTNDVYRRTDVVPSAIGVGGATSNGSVNAYSDASPLFNANGFIVGTSVRYSSTGYLNQGHDAWVFDGANTTQIGYTGTGYEFTSGASTGFRVSSPLGINSQNKVLGYSQRTSGASFVGKVFWIYDPSSGTYENIPLPTGYVATSGNGAGFGELDISSSAWTRINNNGNAAFKAYRYSGTITSTGDVVFYNSTTKSTVVANPTDAIHTAPPGVASDSNPNPNARNVSPVALTNSDYIAGNIAVYYRPGPNNTFVQLGSSGADVFFFNGKTNSSKIINLTGTGYERSDTTQFRSSSMVQITDNGYVIGTSTRFSSTNTNLGTAGWIYDPVADTTTALQFPSFGTNGIATTTPRFVLPNGTVFGDYTLYNASGTSLGSRAFLWNKTDLFTDLGSITPNLASAGWDYLFGGSAGNQYAPLGSLAADLLATDYPVVVAGNGKLLSGSTTTGLVYVAAIPEPGALAPLAVAGVALARRRR